MLRHFRHSLNCSTQRSAVRQHTRLALKQGFATLDSGNGDHRSKHNKGRRQAPWFPHQYSQIPVPSINLSISGCTSRQIHIPLQQRMFSSTDQGSTASEEGQNNPGKKGPELEISGGFKMPDKDMELKLANLQAQVTEHYQKGEFQKALKVSKDLLKQTQDHFGQDHPATASACNNIGLMQKLLGDFTEARRHYTAAMRCYAKVVGRDHASYAMTLHNLGNLNKAQVHFDTDLKATERLNLVETALEYFEEAWAIRKAELGDDHPHTIATKSSVGSTLAAQVLHQHRYVQEGRDGSGGRTKPKYVSLNPESVTQRGWEAAEKHLREAMETSISNPRGKNIHGKKKKGKKGPKASKRQEGEIQTLSAAAAAQNLAVFLKSRAMTEDPYSDKMLDEAQALYQQVEKVRAQLLPNPQHPDLLATKFSLAELLDVRGDEEAANAIRQDILDDYEPPTEAELAAQQQEEASETSVTAKRTVVIDRTTAAKPRS